MIPTAKANGKAFISHISLKGNRSALFRILSILGTLSINRLTHIFIMLVPDNGVRTTLFTKVFNLLLVTRPTLVKTRSESRLLNRPVDDGSYGQRYGHHHSHAWSGVEQSITWLSRPIRHTCTQLGMTAYVKSTQIGSWHVDLCDIRGPQWTPLWDYQCEDIALIYCCRLPLMQGPNTTSLRNLRCILCVALQNNTLGHLKDSWRNSPRHWTHNWECTETLKH